MTSKTSADEVIIKVLEIADKHKNVDLNDWSLEEKEEVYKLFMHMLSTTDKERIFHLEPASEMTEETKRKLKELKAEIQAKEYSISDEYEVSINNEDIKEVN